MGESHSPEKFYFLYKGCINILQFPNIQQTHQFYASIGFFCIWKLILWFGSWSYWQLFKKIGGTSLILDPRITLPILDPIQYC